VLDSITRIHLWLLLCKNLKQGDIEGREGMCKGLKGRPGIPGKKGKEGPISMFIWKLIFIGERERFLL
jgi:hypothetical protein